MKNIINEKNLDESIEYYNSLEEKELMAVTEQFVKEQPALASFVGLLEKDLGEELFDEFSDYAITVWLAFKKQVNELPEVSPENMQDVQRENDKNFENLAKAVDAKSDADVSDKLKEFNEMLGNIQSEKDIDKLKDMLGGEEFKAITENIMGFHQGVNQPVLLDFINDDFYMSPEAVDPDDDKRYQAYMQLIFLVSCFDKALG